MSDHLVFGTIDYSELVNHDESTVDLRTNDVSLVHLSSLLFIEALYHAIQLAVKSIFLFFFFSFFYVHIPQIKFHLILTKLHVTLNSRWNLLSVNCISC